MTKQRVNLMIEDYDNEYLSNTAKLYHMSRSELIGIAINLLTSVNAENKSVLEQLAAQYDEQHHNYEFVPINEKIFRASIYANVQITKPKQ